MLSMQMPLFVIIVGKKEREEWSWSTERPLEMEITGRHGNEERGRYMPLILLCKECKRAVEGEVSLKGLKVVCRDIVD